MLILGPATVIKIYKGSKDTFAYTMTLYTCVFGLTFVAMGSLGLIPHTERNNYVYDALL